MNVCRCRCTCSKWLSWTLIHHLLYISHCWCIPLHVLPYITLTATLRAFRCCLPFQSIIKERKQTFPAERRISNIYCFYSLYNEHGYGQYPRVISIAVPASIHCSKLCNTNIFSSLMAYAPKESCWCNHCDMRLHWHALGTWINIYTSCRFYLPCNHLCHPTSCSSLRATWPFSVLSQCPLPWRSLDPRASYSCRGQHQHHRVACL